MTSAGLLPDYFARIGYTGPAEPTLETLHALVFAHGSRIPFENLDPLLGVPVYDLSASALFDKMVHRRRGGYCYEHNGLMRYVLADLGFGVEALTGRVVWMKPDGPAGPPGPQTHQLLAVQVPDVAQRYLVDVGFGGQTPTAPLRFAVGDVQPTPHEPYRVTSHGQAYVMETQVDGNWWPMYVFTDEPRPLIDLQTGSWYVSTYPQSKFVVGLSASLYTPTERWNMRGRNLAVHRVGVPSERIRFDDADQVLDALAGRFGIDIAGMSGLRERVTAVLDT